MRALVVMLLAVGVMANDLRFSVGIKYWPSDFETSLGTVDEQGDFVGRNESGSGALGGITLALTKDKWNFALTWMDGVSDYTLFRDEIFDTETRYTKSDLDFGVNYSLHQYFGVNVGYKRIETSSETVTGSGTKILDSDVDLAGVYLGAYTSIPVEAARSMVSIGLGYGFLSTSDLTQNTVGGTAKYATDDASGPTGEIAWNLLLNRVVVSLGYKFQDFDYDTKFEFVDFDGQTVESSVSTKDAVKGLTLGVRYFF